VTIKLKAYLHGQVILKGCAREFATTSFVVVTIKGTVLVSAQQPLCHY